MSDYDGDGSCCLAKRCAHVDSGVTFYWKIALTINQKTERNVHVGWKNASETVAKLHMCALCNYLVIFYSSQSITKSHGNDCSSGLCHRVDIQIRCRQGKYNFLFRLFNILIIHKHAVTCGHKLIIIDVRLDRLFWPLFICFVFCGASCEPCVDWVWVMASAQTVTVKKNENVDKQHSKKLFFFCWIIGGLLFLCV